MSGNTEIRAALLTRLTAVSPGAAIPSASVAWENKSFTPTIGTRWYRATFLPGIPGTAGIYADSPNRQVGVLQIDIFEPKDAALGDSAAQIEAERISTCYKRGTVLTYSGVSVVIIRAYRRPALQEQDWFHLPVVIEYRADTAN